MAAAPSPLQHSSLFESVPVNALTNILSYLPLARRDIAAMARVSKAFQKSYQEALADHYVTSLREWKCVAFSARLPGFKSKIDDFLTPHARYSFNIEGEPKEIIFQLWELITSIYYFSEGESKTFSYELMSALNESSIRRNVHNAACWQSGNWMDTY